MSERQCDKCGEHVAASKAFCPACGHAFVDEEMRTDTSEFKMTGGTMQFSQSMYNNMLSDMGLNISKTSEQLNVEVAGAVEKVQPAAPPVHIQQTLQPAAPPAVGPKKNKTRMWLIIGGIVLVLWILGAILAIAFYLLSGRLT